MCVSSFQTEVFTHFFLNEETLLCKKVPMAYTENRQNKLFATSHLTVARRVGSLCTYKRAPFLEGIVAPDITPPTSTDDKPPDIKSFVWKIVSRCFKGGLGIVIFIILLMTFGSWWQWDKVRQLPGIKNVVALVSRESLPKADPNRFAVIVAHIEGDQGQEVEKLIMETLKEFEGIQPLHLNRLIPLERAYPEDREKRGHTKAREYLKKSGAQVLVWGKVVRTSGKSVLELYWTASEALAEARSYGRYQPTENLQLPVISWEHLAGVLRLLITTQNANFYASQGRYIGDQIRPFISKVRQLLKGSEGKPGWNQEARAQTWVILGDSLQVVGEEKGESQAFVEAIRAYREALKERTRERVPLDWAATQNNLGNALASLGDRKKSVELLCTALEKHCLAWGTWYGKAPHYAPIAEDGIKGDLSLLERSFSPATYKACVQRHADTLNRVKRQKILDGSNGRRGR